MTITNEMTTERNTTMTRHPQRMRQPGVLAPPTIHHPGEAPCPRCGDRGPKRVAPTTTVVTVPRRSHTGASILACLLFPPLLLVWLAVAIVRLFAGRQPVAVPVTGPERLQCGACGVTLRQL